MFLIENVKTILIFWFWYLSILCFTPSIYIYIEYEFFWSKFEIKEGLHRQVAIDEDIRNLVFVACVQFTYIKNCGFVTSFDFLFPVSLQPELWILLDKII